MKIYEYKELQKLNQALSSFKKNNVPILEVKLINIKDNVCYFVLTDAEYKPKVKKEDKKKKELKIEKINILKK